MSRGAVTGWILRHRVAAPLALGFPSGIGFGPLFLGSSVAGYLVGRAGLGRRNLALGLCLGFFCGATWLVNGMVASGCPSCVDAVIVLPEVLVFLLVPLAIGHAMGRRSLRRREAHEAG